MYKYAVADIVCSHAVIHIPQVNIVMIVAILFFIYLFNFNCVVVHQPLLDVYCYITFTAINRYELFGYNFHHVVHLTVYFKSHLTIIRLRACV